MPGLELVLVLLTASVGLRVLADRWQLPYTTLLVIGGLALAAVPHLPRVSLEPDALFLIFVPPLLYSAAVAFPLRDLRRASGPIVRLAVLLVLLSTAVTAVVIHAIDSSFTWAAAFTLGAVISAPDPVAVFSVMRGIRLPRQVESILEGEGLVNDATALVLYRVAVAAAVTGTFAAGRTALQFLLVGLGGVVIGIVIGALVLRVRRVTRRNDVADSTVSLLTPFAAYLAAEAVHSSGVISVVAAAMLIGRNVSEIGSPTSRLQNANIWRIVTHLLESLIFIIVGIELPYVIRDLERGGITTLVGESLLIFVAIVAARMLWVFPSTYVGRTIDGWMKGRREIPSWRYILFLGWAGVRGGDSLVIALALPLTTASGAAFPARERIIFITFCVILLTLVIEPPTLRPLARALTLRGDGSTEDEEAHARLTSAEAGLLALDDIERGPLRFPEVARYLRQRHRQRARRWSAQENRRLAHHASEIDHDHFVNSPPSHDGGVLDDQRAEEYRRIRSAMIDAEHRALLKLRDRDDIGDDVMRTVERELDLEQLLLDSGQPVMEPPREVRLAGDATSQTKRS